jgi:ferredoxin-type protein NapF
MDRTSFLKKLLLIDGGKDAINELRGGPGSKAEDERNQPRIPFTFLRPPGARMEPSFLAHCTRCDLCLVACPEHIIVKAVEPLMGSGTPIVNPFIRPCTQCGKCIEACPDAALLATEDPRMGRAVWHAETCLSSTEIACTKCVEACPLGAKAIEAVSSGGISVHVEACTGCGFCVHACPTEPKSLHLEGRPPVPLRGHPRPKVRDAR